MTEKQYRQADSKVFLTLLIVTIGIFLNLLGMVFTTKTSMGIKLVTVLSAVGAIAIYIIYSKLRGNRLCGRYMTAIATVACIAMVLVVDALYFFMLVAALFVAQMAYLDKKRYNITTISILPIFIIRSLLLASKGMVSPTEAGTSIVILILINVSVYHITQIWIGFNNDTIATVGRVSEELVGHFDEANRYITALDEALNTSNLSMQDIATNVESTANEIHHQSQMCVDIGDNTQNAKSQTDFMVEASVAALENVESGAEAMDKLHVHAKNVESENKDTVQYVTALNDRTKTVKKILAMIDDISIQTHLLALNASVEAARAGDAGQGFSVVADEIRNLSEQTKAATADIGNILSELSKDVDRVTESIDRSVAIVGEQNSLIEETKDKFDAINTGVNQLMSSIHDFKRMISGITDASAVIADGVTELSANSEEVAAATSDGSRIMTRAVEDMNQVKVALKGIYELAQHLRDEYNVQ